MAEITLSRLTPRSLRSEVKMSSKSLIGS